MRGRQNPGTSNFELPIEADTPFCNCDDVFWVEDASLDLSPQTRNDGREVIDALAMGHSPYMVLDVVATQERARPT